MNGTRITRYTPDLLRRPGQYHVLSSDPGYAAVVALAGHPRVHTGETFFFPQGETLFFEIRDGVRKNPEDVIAIGDWKVADDHWERSLRNYDNWEVAWWREVLQNARDARGPGAENGPTRVDLTCREEVFVDPDTGASTPAMLCACKDNGTGMDAQTLIRAFFTRSGSVKPADAVGGFGDAKNLILTPWLGYEVRTRDCFARGKHESIGGGGVRTGQPFLQGTEVKVWMPLTQTTTAEHASLVVGRSNLPLRVYVNGENISAKLTGGDVVAESPIRLRIYPKYDDKGRQLSPGRTDAIGNLTISHQKRSQRKGVYVRANGVYMFDMPGNFDQIKGIVYVDIYAPPRHVFTTKRDGLSSESSAKETVAAFLEQLAIEPREALKKARSKKIKQVFKGEGAIQLEGRAAELAAEIFAKLPVKQPKKGQLVELDLGQIDAIVYAVEQQEIEAPAPKEGFVDLAPDGKAVRAILSSVKFAGVDQAANAARFAMWKPDFYLYQNLDTWKLPAKLHPDTMHPKYLKVLRLFAELVKFTLIQVGTFKPFGVGWCFEADDEGTALGMYTKAEDVDWILLNPLHLKPVSHGYGEDYTYEDEGDRYDLGNEKDLEELCSIVIHEVTHMQGFMRHDQSYANALTKNIMVALRGMMDVAKKLVKHVRAEVREQTKAVKAAKAAKGETPWEVVVGRVFALQRTLTDEVGYRKELNAEELAKVVVYDDEQQRFLKYPAMGMEISVPGKKILSAYEKIESVRDWSRQGPTEQFAVQYFNALKASDRVQIPKDPRMGFAETSIPVFSWVRQGNDYMLRKGYVGARGEAVEKISVSDYHLGNQEKEIRALAKMDLRPDTALIFRVRKTGVWSVNLPWRSKIESARISEEKDHAWMSLYERRYDDPENPQIPSKYPTVAEAQEALVQYLEREKAAQE